MNDCFKNIISYKGACETTVPFGGFYTDDVGISLKECDDYACGQYQTGKQLLEAKIQFATDYVRRTILNHFSPNFVAASLIESKRLGQFQDNLAMIAGSAGTLGGIHVELDNETSHYNLYVQDISLQLDYTGDVTVKVYDLIQNKELDSFVVACVANEISQKYINKTYSSDRKKLDLIFVYDTGVGSSNTTTLQYSGCGSCSGYKYWNPYLNAWGITIPSSDTKVKGNVDIQSHTSGMSINYSVNCNTENWLCSMAQWTVLPILYKAAAEVMFFSVNITDRQNSKTDIDRERNRERMDNYLNEFNVQLQNAVSKIKPPKGDPCIICNSTMKTAIVLP